MSKRVTEHESEQESDRARESIAYGIQPGGKTCLQDWLHAVGCPSRSEGAEVLRKTKQYTEKNIEICVCVEM